jgi:hypothetical protein
MLRRFSPIFIPVTILAIGMILFVRGCLLPEYSVPNGNESLFHAKWSDEQLDQWYALRAKIVTRHFEYCDYGWSGILLGLSIVAILSSKRAWTAVDFRQIETPKSKGIFYFLAAITWLSFIPAQVFWISYVDAREDAPFVDNMAVPFFAMWTVGFGVVGLPVILFGVWFVTRRKSLPVPVWSASAPSLAKVAVWIALILAIVVTVGCVITEPPLVPSCVFTVYLLLCGRAIAVSPDRFSDVRGFEVVQRGIFPE